MRENSNSSFCRLLFYSAASIGLIASTNPLSLSAKVTGTCASCHTMHNSQDNAPLSYSGTGAGWTGDNGELTGGSSQSPQGSLLVSDCVGCHSATTDDTIIDLGSNRIPIVLNINQYPTKQLAGGNFHQVSKGSEYDGYGHNVYGISSTDLQLSAAPGNTRCGGAGQTGACHQTLAAPPSENNYERGGCQGCHFHVYHHEDNINYRFLNSHAASKSQFNGNNAFVEGVEHAYWEHPDHTSLTSHNYYKGVDKSSATPQDEYNLKTTHSISSYCGGCHADFHSAGETGTASPWLRHPTDIALPMAGEYLQYNPVTNYSLQAPVAWVNPGQATAVREEAIVMCLSCHRVHGSEYPDILRWNYDEMIADGGSNEEGCFVCHATKDQ